MHCIERFLHVSAVLAYMAEVAHATGPALRGPAHMGKIIYCARVNCGMASWIVFTTAILHWHNRLQHIRGNIRALVEFTNAADEVGWVRDSVKAILSDCYDCIKELVWGNPKTAPLLYKSLSYRARLNHT